MYCILHTITHLLYYKLETSRAASRGTLARARRAAGRGRAVLGLLCCYYMYYIILYHHHITYYIYYIYYIIYFIYIPASPSRTRSGPRSLDCRPLRARAHTRTHTIFARTADEVAAGPGRGPGTPRPPPPAFRAKPPRAVALVP